MGSNAEAVSKRLEEIPIVQWLVGKFAGRATEGMVQVDFGQGPVTILTTGFTEPLLGQSVRCLRTTDATIMVGLAIPRSEIGTVTATGSPMLTVTTSLGTEQMPRVTTYSAVIGDTVLISPGGIVIGKVSATPTGTYVPPSAEPQVFSADFRAIDSGSYQGSWNKLDVWASDSNVGAWFYDSSISDTIPDTATIGRIDLYMPEFYNVSPAALAAVGLHGLTGKSGALSLTSPTPIAGGAGWHGLPTSFADALKTGAYKGVGVQQAVAFQGFHKYTSRAGDADSGLLRITWVV